MPQSSQGDELRGSEQFRGNLRTLLHNQLSGDSGKLIDGSDVIDSEDGNDGSDVIDSSSSNDGSDVTDSDDGDYGGNLDGGRQMKRLPGFASKTEVVPILGEVVPIKSG